MVQISNMYNMSSRNSVIIYVIFLLLILLQIQCTAFTSNVTRIHFGSCNHQNIANAITWKSIVDRNADIFIWTGDVVYLDHELQESSYPYSDYSVILYVFNALLLGNPPVADPTTWPAKYELMKDNLKYQELTNLTTIIGVWDDHDIGENNADYSWEHKDYAQTLFLDFLKVPQNDTKRSQRGVYDFYQMNATVELNDMTFIKTIDIVMFDTRYFAKQDGEEDILGVVQWQWFEDILKNKLSGELLIIISSVQIMNNPPLNSREGWWKYDYSKKKLFKLLTQYNTNERLLLISGDVHLSEMMHAQCNGKNANNSGEMYDFYEVTSSGITHAMFYESPYLEKFSYRLDDYAQEDGVIGCNWLGRNFGELNIDWFYDQQTNDAKIKNVSVEIRDENGDIKCMFDLPKFGYSDQHKYKSSSNDLFWDDYHICYGAETFHSKHGVRSVQAICGMAWVFMVMYPNVFALMLFLYMIEAIKACCRAGTRLDCCQTAQPPRLRSDTAGGDSFHGNNPNFDGRNDRDVGHFEAHEITEFDDTVDDVQDTADKQEQGNTRVLHEDEANGVAAAEKEIVDAPNNEIQLSEMTVIQEDEANGTVTEENATKTSLDNAEEDESKGKKMQLNIPAMMFNKVKSLSTKSTSPRHAVQESLMNPSSLYGNDDANTDTFHNNFYYKSYGYVLFKNKLLYFLFITIVFLIGFRLLGPYNSEYPGNLTVLITFGIIYCWQEICFGFYCVYAFEVAKHVCIVTTAVCAICIIISWVDFKEIIISLTFILADCVSIVSSIFVISHGYMPKTYITIIAFQILVAGHKIYSLGSHLIYVHNDVPFHTNVGWYWIVQICLVKIYLSQFIFRSKLEFITGILYDGLLITRKKYRTFERVFAVLLLFVFGVCSFYMATNSNDWDEGYVAVGTYLEFAFMFNWPSAIFLALWLWIKNVKIYKKHEYFHKQLTKRTLRLSSRMKADLFGGLDEKYTKEEQEQDEYEKHKQEEIDENAEKSGKISVQQVTNNEDVKVDANEQENNDSSTDEEVP